MTAGLEERPAAPVRAWLESLPAGRPSGWSACSIRAALDGRGAPRRVGILRLPAKSESSETLFSCPIVEIRDPIPERSATARRRPARPQSRWSASGDGSDRSVIGLPLGATARYPVGTPHK
jgi:hypothetical protein